jgi:hypothetical protein
MATQGHDRIRFVTHHYGDLQGFRFLVPVGLCIIALSLTFSITAFVLMLLGTLAFVRLAQRYYRSTFGEVERHQSYQILPFCLASSVQELLHRYGSLSMARSFYLVFGALFVLWWVMLERRLSQAYYLVLAALLLGIGALVPYSLWLGGALTSGMISRILLGFALVLAGLLDHRQLVKVMGQVTAPSLEMTASAQAEVKR